MNDLFSGLTFLMGAPATGANADPTGQLVSTVVMFGLVFVVFYFLIIRPQNKKQKETKKMLEALKKGDKVQTIGGLRGTVWQLKEDSVIIKADDDAKLEFVRSAIASVLEQKPAEEAKDTKETKAEEGTTDAAEAPAKPARTSRSKAAKEPKEDK